jgi:glycosyltransferase involved in cell wall biosynthesis
MILDWFFPYAAGVANALADVAQVVVITRDHGLEVGAARDAISAKRALLDDRVHTLIIRGRQRDLGSVSDVLHVRRLLQRFPPDVFHVQDHADWRLYGLQRSLPRVPTLLTIHDVVFHAGEKHREDASLPLRRRLGRSVRSHAGTYVVHGRGLADLLAAQDWYCGQAIHVIPHGRLPYAASSEPLPARPTILFFGRLEYYKGLDILVEAAEIAARHIPGLKVIVAGLGPDGSRCQAMVKSPEIFDWRLGFVPHEETAALFAEASIVVLPYRDASQSGVVPMAFANGRPVIATDVGSLSEAVLDGQDGLLVHEVSAGAIAAAIVRAFTEPGLLPHLAAGARATMTSGPLAPGNIAELHLDAYRQLAQGAAMR